MQDKVYGVQYNFQSKYFKLDWQFREGRRRDNFFLSQFSFWIRKFLLVGCWGEERNDVNIQWKAREISVIIWL